MRLTFTAGSSVPKEYDLEAGEENKELGAHVFQWKSVNHLSKLPHGSNYVLSFFVEPKFHWKNVMVNDSTIEMYMTACSRTEMLKFPEGWVTFTYKAQRKYDAEHDENMIEFALLSVVLGIYEYHYFLRGFRMKESHQIFAVVKLEKGHTVVLGRAQSVETTEYGGTRTYKWIARTRASDTTTFKGVPRRSSMGSHMEDLYIMDQLKQGPLLSARPKREYEADNDLFSNPNSVLPITVPKDQDGGSIVIQFFNAKFKPAPFVEASVRWSTIFGQLNLKKKKKRGNLMLLFKSTTKDTMEYVHEEVLNEFLAYKIKFTGPNDISMIELTFVAHEYHFSLDSMGKNIKLNSI